MQNKIRGRTKKFAWLQSARRIRYFQSEISCILCRKTARAAGDSCRSRSQIMGSVGPKIAQINAVFAPCFAASRLFATLSTRRGPGASRLTFQFELCPAFFADCCFRARCRRLLPGPALALKPSKASGIYELVETAGWTVTSHDKSPASRTIYYMVKKNNYERIASGPSIFVRAMETLKLKVTRSLCVASLHPKVAHVIVDVPAGYDTNGPVRGRQSSYPNFPTNDPRIMGNGNVF